MDLAKLRRGELIAAVGGIVLLIALFFFDWYSESITITLGPASTSFGAWDGPGFFGLPGACDVGGQYSELEAPSWSLEKTRNGDGPPAAAIAPVPPPSRPATTRMLTTRDRMNPFPFRIRAGRRRVAFARSGSFANRLHGLICVAAPGR